MLSVKLPYLPQADSLSNSDALASLLENKGVKIPIDSVNWPVDFPYHPLTSVLAVHSGTAIYLLFMTRCNFLRAENFTNNSPVSEDSCVEFFVEPRPGGDYWNFEFNCIGTVNASHRIERPNPIRLTDAEIDSITRWPWCGTRPFRELEGIFRWRLLVKIPLQLIGVTFEGKAIDMRGNFYKCASASSQPHYLSWNPVATERPDFHRPEYFGRIILDAPQPDSH